MIEAIAQQYVDVPIEDLDLLSDTDEALHGFATEDSTNTKTCGKKIIFMIVSSSSLILFFVFYDRTD